jgi:hypothetical protein
MDIRKYGIAIAVAILTAIFIYAVADAIAPPIDYNACNEHYRSYPEVGKQTNCSAVPMDKQAERACTDQEFTYQPVYDEYGCVESWECNSCFKEQQDKQQERNMIIFLAAVTLGLLSIIAGFLLPLGAIHEWVGLGFIIGGVISMFVGTAQYWGDLGRLWRPFVIGLELAVLLAIVYKRVNQQPAQNIKAKEKKKRA